MHPSDHSFYIVCFLNMRPEIRVESLMIIAFWLPGRRESIHLFQNDTGILSGLTQHCPILLVRDGAERARVLLWICLSDRPEIEDRAAQQEQVPTSEPPRASVSGLCFDFLTHAHLLPVFDEIELHTFLSVREPRLQLFRFSQYRRSNFPLLAASTICLVVVVPGFIPGTHWPLHP
mgnify:CR=1 FL=1